MLTYADVCCRMLTYAGKSDKLRQIQQFVSVVNRAVTDSGLAKDVQSEV